MKNKNLLFLVFLFLQIHFIIGQQSIEWQRSLGGVYYDYAESIIQTTDGGYIMAARTASDGDSSSNGSSDYWVVKLSSVGDIEWKKFFGGSAFDSLNDIQQTADGGYILAGDSQSNDVDVTINYGAEDYWIVKITSTGNIEWQKSFGGSGKDSPDSIKQTTDGGYIIAGLSNSEDGHITNNLGLNDFWIVKLSNSGSMEWEKSLGGSNNDVAYSIEQTTDDGYIVAGSSSSNDGDVTDNKGAISYWVVKLSNLGSIEWQKSFGGTDDDRAKSIIQTTEGGFIVLGDSESNDVDVTGNNGSRDIWIVKITSSGVLEWQKSLGGSYLEYGDSIQQTSDSGYILAGSSSSIDGDLTSNNGQRDYWIVKLTNTGNIEWQKSYGGTGVDNANSIQQTSDNNGYIVVGFSSSSISGDKTEHNGYGDCWVIKLSNSLDINDTVDSYFNLYPNPTTSLLNVRSKNKISSIKIYNNLGQIIIPDFNISKPVIDVSKLKTGFYFVKIEDIFGDFEIKKIIKK